MSDTDSFVSASGSFVGSFVGDDNAPNCPLCDAPFTTTFRRHHCRQCHGLVCDNCSPHRLQLPKEVGKVRVCTPCAKALATELAAGVEEDMAEASQILVQLRNEFDKTNQECEMFKRFCLELLGDQGDVEQFGISPNDDAYSFENIKSRMQAEWSQFQSSLEAKQQETTLLQDRLKELKEKKEAVEAKDKVISEKFEAVKEKVENLESTKQKCAILTRLEAELEEKVQIARKQIHEKELKRLEQQERPRSASGTSLPGGTMAFTISTGREDPLLAQNAGGRLHGCRRACTLM